MVLTLSYISAVVYLDSIASPYKEVVSHAVDEINKDQTLLPYSQLEVVFRHYKDTPNNLVENRECL